MRERNPRFTCILFAARYLAPAIDLPISLEGVTVEELAILSAEEFANAQLQDPDLINLSKWVTNSNSRL